VPVNAHPGKAVTAFNMKNLGAVLVMLAAATMAFPSYATTQRDPAVRKDFQRTHPCPSNHETSGPCPGWVVDHIVPLCAGGADREHAVAVEARGQGKGQARAC